MAEDAGWNLISEDPYVHPAGEPVTDLDGVPVTVGVDYDAVTLTSGRTWARFSLDQAGRLMWLLTAAYREAERNQAKLKEQED